jgi:mono/diheme cytochrome c family protein
VGVRDQAIANARVTRQFVIWAAACFVAATTANAQAAGPPATRQQEAEVDQALIDPGKATYAQKCSHCHGPGMVNSGTITPDLRKFPDDKERFVTTVKLGKNGKMPPWSDILSDDQIAGLWVYVSSLRKP